jgi:SAM-dependent methyltransferase
MDIVQKTKEDYNKIAGLYAKTRVNERELAYFAPFIKSEQCILDWGCGNGRLIHLLKDKNVQYVGVDQSEAMIRAAEAEFAPEIAQGWASFQTIAGLPPWPFAGASFDVVFMIASLLHMPDESSRLVVLEEARRLLKPEGMLVITTWNLTSAWATAEKVKWQQLNEQDFLIPWKTPQGESLVERFYHHFEPEELVDLVAKAGFKVQEWCWMDGVLKSDRLGGKNLVVLARRE